MGKSSRRRRRSRASASETSDESTEAEPGSSRPLLLFDDPLKAGLVGAVILVVIALLRRFAC